MAPISRAAFLFITLFLAAGLAGCGRLGIDPRHDNTEVDHSSTREDADLVAATLGDRDITIAEIDEYLKNAFIEDLRSRPASEVYERRSQGLKDLIQKQAVDAAAAERGVESQALFEEVIAEVAPPSAEEIANWYSENQSKLGGARLEQVSSNIEDLLLNEKRGKVWSSFMSDQLDSLDFKLIFEPPRIELEVTRLIRGNPDAPVTIMTFSDYQCPYCIRSEPVLAEVLTRYPDQVRVVHRHFPLDSIHPFARPAAEAAMCADEQGKFWEYHDAIFARGGKLSTDSFAEIDRELGLDAEAQGSCRTDRRYADFVQQDFDAGRAAGVTGTPAFFVNGIALKGSRTADQISQIVDDELERIEVN